VAFLVLELTQQLVSQFCSSNHVAISRRSPAPSAARGVPRSGRDNPAIVQQGDLGKEAAEGEKEETRGKIDAGKDYMEVLARVDKFTRIHAHCYVLLQAPLFTERELSALYLLQTR
ncbi:hypothetical protein PoB_005142300, partial [Plakobranchus ocellatus]